MEHYLIVADDFTGANDTGVQLRRRGIPVSVVFKDEMIKYDGSVVIDTESRALTVDKTFEKVSQDTAKIKFEKFAHVMKKVDSTLRGNIGAETSALDKHFKAELIIFAPALPDLGRVTVNSIHILNGIPITKTEIARDPKTPVKEDNINKLLQTSFTDEPVVHIGLEAVRSKNIKLNDARIFTFDAETNMDMQNIIQAALAEKKRILWVGTAAMADNLLSINHSILPALAIVASLSSVTRAQVLYAQQQGINLVKVHLYDVLEKKTVAEEYVMEAVELLKEGKDVIVLSASTYSIEEYKKAEEIAKKNGLSSEQMSEYTQKVMAEISGLILKETKVSGVFLAGGDTAMGFFNIVKSEGSSIVTEIAVGIPLMRLRGGVFEGLKIVTKAGAFGKEDAIFYSLRKIKETDI
ncbi:MAG: four-carbon acid sugar kinase family protein [Elusimicrobiota bacterium]|jgi:uncharacterized protein YgbK (DUF1537 family)|nr:four-carbon acid sugar kinase family protein [Elusimicrobiota bacterium]